MSGADERMVAIACDGLGQGAALEGLYLRAEGQTRGSAVVAPPHPLYGGSMDNPVVSELAFVCARAGLVSLRFNWRGVGASSGVPSGELADAADDYAAALSHLRDSAPGPRVLCGYSFGAAAAAAQLHRADAHGVERLVLVAPPPGLLDGEGLRAFRGAVLFVAGQEDSIAPPAALARIAHSLSAARFVLLPKTDHFFAKGLAGLGRETLAWLAGGAEGAAGAGDLEEA